MGREAEHGLYSEVHLSVGDPGFFEGVIETVEMHAGGEPVRIVTSGYPVIPGKTILDKRRYARDHLDHLRTRMIFEPRGHDAMYGVIPVECQSALNIDP